MLCSATNPNLPGWLDAPATITPRGSNSAANPSRARAGVAVAAARRRRFVGVVELDERVDGDGLAVDDDERVDVDRGDVGAVLARGATGRAASPRSAARSTAGSPRNGPSSFWVARSSISSSASSSRERDEPERDVAERFGEHAADAEHHARAELRIAHEPGDQLAGAAHHRRDEQLDRAVVGAGRGEQLGAAASDRGGVAQAEAHEAALGLVRDRVAAQLHHDRDSRSRRRPPTAASASARGALVEHRHAVARQQLLRRGFGEGRHGGRGYRRPDRAPPHASTANAGTWAPRAELLRCPNRATGASTLLRSW